MLVGRQADNDLINSVKIELIFYKNENYVE